jgi:hypothetical protein
LVVLEWQKAVLAAPADCRNAAHLSPAEPVAAISPKTCHKKSSKCRASDLFLPGFAGFL